MKDKCMSYKVLIVDDSKLARMSVARLLETLRPAWTRIEATNAAEAIARQSQEAVDVALVDFNMPGPDGLSVAADLHANSPSMPMAIVSANNQDEIVARAHALGAAFLSKPLTQKALAEFLSDVESRLEKPPRPQNVTPLQNTNGRPPPRSAPLPSTPE
jgi:DNA-binding NarL/FixJ family response regulator